MIISDDSDDDFHIIPVTLLSFKFVVHYFSSLCHISGFYDSYKSLSLQNDLGLMSLVISNRIGSILSWYGIIELNPME